MLLFPSAEIIAWLAQRCFCAKRRFYPFKTLFNVSSRTESTANPGLSLALLGRQVVHGCFVAVKSLSQVFLLAAFSRLFESPSQRPGPPD
jgi:hypothetical protein